MRAGELCAGSQVSRAITGMTAAYAATFPVTPKVPWLLMLGHHLLHPARYKYPANELAEAYHGSCGVSMEFEPSLGRSVLMDFTSMWRDDNHLPGL